MKSDSNGLPSKKYKIFIACHETLPCYVAEYLKTYLIETYSVDLLFIAHPLLDTSSSYKRESRYEYFENSKFLKEKKAFHWVLPKPVLFVKDMIYTFAWCLSSKGRYDAFFGMDCINVLVALFLKRIGKIKKVIYHTIDYYPTRFQNKILNWLYYQLDKICVRWSDETWNVSGAMVHAREKKMGMIGKEYSRQYTFPICVWVNKVEKLPFEKINKKKIIYRGSLHDYMGVDLIIKSMPDIIKKIPGAFLEIYGDGDQKEALNELTRSLNMEKYIKFYGWIKDRKELERLMSDGAIGIATFNTEIIDDKVKNADPGKIKDYMLMGMPTITTNNVSYWLQIEKSKCGIVIEYNESAMKEAVVRLLTSPNLLKEYRTNALEFVKQFDCGKLFDVNVTRVLN